MSLEDSKGLSFPTSPTKGGFRAPEVTRQVERAIGWSVCQEQNGPIHPQALRAGQGVRT